MPPRKKRLQRKSRPSKAMRDLRAVIGHSFATFAADTKEAADRRFWLRGQPCALSRLFADPCSNDQGDECHVNEGKGVGMKAPHPTFKLCRRHHEMYDGQAGHKTVVPLSLLLWRALGRLLSEDQERQWQDVVAHEARRKAL
jgi:hypothetical protein